MKRKIEICLDFDGTVVSHEYPNIGNDIGSVEVLHKLINNGHKLILFTMRSHRPYIDFDGNSRDCLQEAIDWFDKNEIPLYGIQTNPNQKDWTDSPKAYGQLMIDDIAAFAPLKLDKKISERPFIDWIKMENELIRLGLINEEEL